MTVQEIKKSPRKTQNSELLCTDDPIINVLSRKFAWEGEIRGRGIDEVDGERSVARVRYELGFTGKGTNNKSWYNDNKDRIHKLTQAKKETEPDWRFLYLPSHLNVRTLAWDADVDKVNTKAGEKLVSFDIVFGDPVIPALTIFIGVGVPERNDFIKKRAIYLLLHKETDSESLYIGKADNGSQRIKQHQVPKKPFYYFLAFPKDTEAQFNGDVRDATEALMIAFWSEIANVSNSNLGTTIKPLSAADFHMAILLTSAISAAYTFTVRNTKEILDKLKTNNVRYLGDEINLALGLSNETKLQIPFIRKTEGRNLNGWGECYLTTNPDPLVETK
jgi:hypothetical protein